MKILVSACLLGENCKYNGGNNKNDKVLALADEHTLVPICPECFGGLPIPRLPSEIRGSRVFAKDGTDVTAQFTDGAEKALYVAEESGCQLGTRQWLECPQCTETNHMLVYEGTNQLYHI